MKNKVLSIVLSIIIAIVGICITVSGFSSGNRELVSVSGLTMEELDGTQDYEIPEAYLLDSYASYEENGDITSYYMAVGFYDADDYLCVVSMEVEKDDPCYDVIMDYLNDDSMYMGDLVLPLYASSTTFTQTSELGQYFGEFAQELSSNGVIAEPLWIQLDYMGETKAAYEDALSQSSTKTILLGIVFILLAVIFFVFSRIRAKKSASATQAQPNGYPRYCPNCGAPISPDDAFCSDCGAAL